MSRGRGPSGTTATATVYDARSQTHLLERAGSPERTGIDRAQTSGGPGVSRRQAAHQTESLMPACSNYYRPTVRSCSGQPRSFAPSTAVLMVNRWAGSVGSYPVSVLIRSRR